jgi:hypothetical protein
MKTKSVVVLMMLSGCGVVDGRPSGSTPTGRSRQPVLSCPQSPAKEVFTAALCLCGDYEAVGEGAWIHGGRSGINGSLDVVGDHRFGGDVTAYGGVSGAGDLAVDGTLSTRGQVSTTGTVVVSRDLNAASGVHGVGELTVKGTLRTPEAESWTGIASVAAKGPLTPMGGPPCACGAEQRLDVAGKIASAEKQNDNRAAGLSLRESVGERTITLGSGSYFFDGVKSVGSHTVTIDGAVALFVEGDFKTVGSTHLSLTPGSTLDLYVEGNLSTVGDSSFGAGASVGSVRIYLTPERSLSMVGAQTVVGSIYAPGSDLKLVGESAFKGSLFVRDIQGVGRLQIESGDQTVATPESDLCRPSNELG